MSDPEAIRILVANLPPDVTEDDVLDALEALGYELNVTLVHEGSAERVMAAIRFEGMTRNTAEALARRINGMPWRDRTLRAYVPLFMQ